MADNNPKKPIPPASTQRTTMVMVIILLAVAFFVGSQFMRTGAMGTTVTDQLITSEFTQAVEVTSATTEITRRAVWDTLPASARTWAHRYTQDRIR